MMKGRIKTLLLGVVLALFGFFQGGSGGCGSVSPGGAPISVIAGGGNPAAPPAPPAELPAFLTIPTSVGIDVSKTASSGGPALVLKNASGTGPYANDISFSANLVQFATIRLNGLLELFQSVKIPVRSDLHKMDTYIGIGGTVYTVHINFDDFDLDGDGAKEGCSGSTAPLTDGTVRICMRVWVEDWFQIGAQTRLLAARFDSYPTDTNPGSGSLRGHDINFGLYQVRADYNHIDPQDKSTDSYTALLIDPNDPPNPEPVNPVLEFSIRAFASQKGPDATALKTTNGNSNDGASATGGFGRWLENDDLWRGSFHDATDPTQNVDDICAVISTGDAASPASACEDLGIQITDLAFFPPMTAQDVEFFDFPATAP